MKVILGLVCLRVFLVTILSVLGASGPYSGKINPDDPSIKEAVLWNVDRSKTGISVSVACAYLAIEGVIYLVRRGNSITLTHKKLCDSLHYLFFADKPGDQKALYRVTLFKACEGKLGIVSRSGFLHVKSKTYFLIDDERPETNEGFAGRVYMKDCYLAEDFPLWDNADPDSQKRYAQASMMTPERVRTLRKKASSFCGTVIRKSGTKWGVLVLDGPKPGDMAVDERKHSLIDAFALTFGELV